MRHEDLLPDVDMQENIISHPLYQGGSVEPTTSHDAYIQEQEAILATIPFYEQSPVSLI